MGQAETVEGVVPVAQAFGIQGLAGAAWSSQMRVAPAWPASSASSARLPRSGSGGVAGDGQACRREAAELLQQLVTGFAAVEHASVGYRLGQGGWPGALIVQLQAHQQGATAAKVQLARLELRQRFGAASCTPMRSLRGIRASRSCA